MVEHLVEVLPRQRKDAVLTFGTFILNKVSISCFLGDFHDMVSAIFFPFIEVFLENFLK